MGDKNPQVVGPLHLCFSLIKNGVYIEVDQSVATELESLATELFETRPGKERKKIRQQLQNKLLSLCDGWTVLKGKRIFRDYPTSKTVVSDAVNGQWNTTLDQFIDAVNSPPLRGQVPSESIDQWRDQLLGLLRSMTAQNREVARRCVSNLVWVELVKPSIRAEHLNLLNGTKIERHDISEWYAIPIPLAKPCKFCDGKFPCNWPRSGRVESTRCRECILAGRNRCFQVAQAGYQLASGPRSLTSDDSEYRGHIGADDGFLPLPITRRADEENTNVVDGAICGQKRPSPPSNNNSQYGATAKRPRTGEDDTASTETPKTLVMDVDFQDDIAEWMTQMENAIKEARKENRELRNTNESLEAKTADLKAVNETTLTTLQCLQADITHVESIVQALRNGGK